MICVLMCCRKSIISLTKQGTNLLKSIRIFSRNFHSRCVIDNVTTKIWRHAQGKFIILNLHAINKSSDILCQKIEVYFLRFMDVTLNQKTLRTMLQETTSNMYNNICSKTLRAERYFTSIKATSTQNL